jgi:hypothetical protein
LTRNSRSFVNFERQLGISTRFDVWLATLANSALQHFLYSQNQKNVWMRIRHAYNCLREVRFNNKRLIDTKSLLGVEFSSIREECCSTLEGEQRRLRFFHQNWRLEKAWPWPRLNLSQSAHLHSVFDRLGHQTEPVSKNKAQSAQIMNYKHVSYNKL